MFEPTPARAETRARHQPRSVAPMAASPRAPRHARVAALRVLKKGVRGMRAVLISASRDRHRSFNRHWRRSVCSAACRLEVRTRERGRCGDGARLRARFAPFFGKANRCSGGMLFWRCNVSKKPTLYSSTYHRIHRMPWQKHTHGDTCKIVMYVCKQNIEK